MGRYIDADKVMEEINRIGGHNLCEWETIGVKALIDRQQTADVVEVVRCKDCKHWMKDVAGCTDFVGRCEYANYMVGANGYCVYGEKALKEREKE